MFATRFFPGRFYAGRYFPKIGADLVSLGRLINITGRDDHVVNITGGGLMPVALDISWYKGEDIKLRVVLFPAANITGWTIAFTVKQNFGDTAVLISKTTTAGQILITDALQGIFEATINSADTSTLAPRNYVYDVSRSDSGASTVLDVGILTLKPEVRI